MKKFKEFNEGAMYFLKPKSEEEMDNIVDDTLEKLSDYKKILYIYKYKLPERYLPKDAKKIIEDHIYEHLVTSFSNGIFVLMTYENFDRYDLPEPKKGKHKIRGFNTRGIIIETFKIFKNKYIIPYSDLSIDSLLKVARKIGLHDSDDMYQLGEHYYL